MEKIKWVVKEFDITGLRLGEERKWSQEVGPIQIEGEDNLVEAWIIRDGMVALLLKQTW